MNRIVLDPQLAKQLHDLSGPLELCDASGRVLARAIPVADLSECEPITPGISDEELARRSSSNETRHTTREVLDHLRQL